MNTSVSRERSTKIIFASALILSFAFCLIPLSAQEKANETDASALQPIESDEPTFQPTMYALGIGEGVAWSNTTYRATDGQLVYLSRPHFHLADAAKSEYERLVKTATAVIERYSGKTGDITRERSVLTLPAKGEARTLTVIVLRRDADLWEISSYSAQDAFGFENQLRRDIHWNVETP
jgi:hypothetical protein